MNTNLLGWTMLHFLWFGTALLVLAAIVRLALRRTGANVRYVHSLATLLALAALPIGIAAWLSQTELPRTQAADSVGAPIDVPSVEGGWGRGEAEPPVMLAEPQPQIIELNPDYNPNDSAQTLSLPPLGGEEPVLWDAAWPASDSSVPLTQSTATGKASGTLEVFLAYLQSAVPYLPYLWLLGTPITFALLATGLIGAERMRRQGTLITDGPVHDACERLRASLRITRKVALAVCDRVAQPVLVGIVRPLILLPPAALAGWSPAELEMVLLHELAHVRRWDNLVNLAQRVIESLLFFHPAVWIVSTWVRRDREDCCDAVVVTRTEQPKQYAELLVALASPQPYAGLAMARHPLAGRLRRILKLEDEPMLVSRNTIGLLTLAVVAIALVVVSGPLRVQGEQKPSEGSAATDSPSPGIEKSEANPAQESQSLADAIKEFNSQAQRDRIGQAQPPLTEKEVIAAIQMWIRESKPETTDEIFKTFQDIASTRRMPAGAVLKFTTGWTSPQNQEFDVWWVDLSIVTGPDSGYSFRIRDTKVGSLQSDEAVLAKSEDESIVDPSLIKKSEANPLAGIAYPSPREGEIALRAWEELKIKVAPATDEELEPTRAPDSELQAGRGFSHRGGLKLIDFNENFPQLQGTPILKELGCSAISTHIGGFDDLAKALDAIAAKKSDTIILNGMIGGNRFNYSMTYPVTQPAPVVSPSSKTIARVYDIPRNTLNTPAAVELENWINAQKIQVMDDSPPDNRVIITATEAQHERIAEFLTDKPDDRIVKSHDIPKELRDSVRNWADTAQSIQGVWDDRGQFIMQAARKKHDELDRLVQGMEQWNDPEAAKDRTKNPIVKREENGQPVLEWRSAGLTLKGETLVKTFPQSSRNNMSGQTGVAVVAVEPGSPAAWRDIQPGDVLTRVGNFQTENVPELASVLESFLQGFERNKVLELIFYRGQSEPQWRGQPRAQSRSLPLRAEPVKVTDAGEDANRREESLRRLREQGEKIIEGQVVNSDAGVISRMVPMPTPPPSVASAEELEALRDYVKVIEEYYKLIDSLHREGVKGGEANKRELAAYEMYVAQGELALAEGNQKEAHLKFDAALNSAHNAFEAATEAYKNGTVTYDFLLQAIKNKAEIRRKIIQLKVGKQASAPPATSVPAASNRGVAGRMVYESNPDGTVVGRMVYPQPAPSIGEPLAPIPPTAIGPPTATFTPGVPVNPPVATNAPTDPSLTPSQTLPSPPTIAPPTYYTPPATPVPTNNTPYDPLAPPTNPWSTDWPEPSTTPPTSNQPQPTKQPAWTSDWPTTTPPTSTTQPQPSKPNAVIEPPSIPPIINQQSSISNSPPVYRYDGKTFQTWRDTWKHELSTEKRIEAVKALAAFGRAGYAKEAAETILDVAGEYEFQTIDSNLRDAIVTAFAELKFADWQPLLQQRYDADPEKWESIATNIFRLSRPESDDERKLRQQFLLKIAKHGTQAQLLAFQSLVGSGVGVDDEEIKNLALEGLKSDDNTLGSWALMAFSRAGYFPPEYIDILLHGDQEKQRAARSWLRNSGEKALPVVEMLLEILKDNEQSADHLAAIRALGVMKASVISAPADLRRILRDEKEDLRLRVAAAVALDQIEPRKNEGRLLLFSDVVGEEQEDRSKLMMEEMRELKLPTSL